MRVASFFLVVFLSSPVFSQQAGTIQRVTLQQGSGQFNVFVLGDGTLECNTVLMSNPPRIALDFPNVKNTLYPNSIEAEDNEFVHRVLTSQYAKGRDTISRILVELKAQFDYKMNKTKGGIVLQLIAHPPKDQKKQPAIPKEQTAASSQASTTPPASLTSASPPVSPSPPPATSLTIGPEDLLEISVFDLPQFNTTTRVLGDGTVSIPLVGSVEVHGLNKLQCEQKIAAALQKYVNNASVSVTVKEYKSQQISLLGAVRSPGAYYVTSQRNLLQLITEAGGLSPEAGKKCFVFRPGSPKIEIDLYDLINNGNPEQNIAIYPGDVVNIPGAQKVIVYVFGAVRSPGAIELSSSMPLTFLAAIAQAGGPSDQANKSDIKIKRKAPDGTETIIKVNMKDILKGKAEDIPIEPGDVINVPESFF